MNATDEAQLSQDPGTVTWEDPELEAALDMQRRFKLAKKEFFAGEKSSESKMKAEIKEGAERHDVSEMELGTTVICGSLTFKIGETKREEETVTAPFQRNRIASVELT